MINVNKSKLRELSKSEEYGALNVQLNREKIEDLHCLRYLRVDLGLDEGMNAKWKHSG